MLILAGVFFLGVKKKVGLKAFFSRFFVFFTGKMRFSRACFSGFFTFFTCAIGFHGQIFDFLHGQKNFFTPKKMRIFTGKFIFSRAFFFSRAHFLKFSWARNLVSWMEFFQNFSDTLVFNAPLFSKVELLLSRKRLVHTLVMCVL